MDRVEVAFRRMDRNKDGYIDWEEFLQVNIPYLYPFSLLILLILLLLFWNTGDLDLEQAERIFHKCDQVVTCLLNFLYFDSFYQDGDQKISLGELQAMANRNII